MIDSDSGFDCLFSLFSFLLFLSLFDFFFTLSFFPFQGCSTFEFFLTLNESLLLLKFVAIVRDESLPAVTTSLLELLGLLRRVPGGHVY